MLGNAAIFLNNSDCNKKAEINLSNLKLLKSNFDTIFIIESDNNFTKNLKKKEKNIIILNVNMSDNIEKIVLIHDKVLNFKTVTFFDDNFIILNDLREYFKFTSNNDYDICSYSDSTENFYHLQTNIFTIKKKIYDNFFNSCKDLLKSKNLLSKKVYYDNFNKLLNSFECKKGVFLKIAYMDINYNKNIYNEYNEYYIELLKNDLLPIISYKILKYFDDKYDNQNFSHTKIPDDFDINIYKKYDDLRDFDENFLKNHFLEHGQFECRIYNKNFNILPDVIYRKLSGIKLLKFFDFPEDFDFNVYKYQNGDLNTLNKLQLKKHWFEYGIYEKRKIN